jgi:class 3 adenylate cyclase
MSFEFFPAEQSELWKLIEERANPDSDPAEVDQRIWETFGADGAIVFSDLKGFTRRTEELGITHFLQTVYRSQILLRPIIEQHQGVVIEVIADSMMLWFDDVDDAVNCSIAMQQACKEFNDGLEPSKQVLLCLGIGYGRTLKVGDTRLAGAEVNVAAKLGEDTAEGYEILVSNSVKDSVTPSDQVEFALTGLSFPGSPEVYRINYD